VKAVNSNLRSFSLTNQEDFIEFMKGRPTLNLLTNAKPTYTLCWDQIITPCIGPSLLQNSLTPKSKSQIFKTKLKDTF